MHYPLGDHELLLIEHFLNQEDADRLLEQLLEEHDGLWIEADQEGALDVVGNLLEEIDAEMQGAVA